MPNSNITQRGTQASGLGVMIGRCSLDCQHGRQNAWFFLFSFFLQEEKKSYSLSKWNWFFLKVYLPFQYICVEFVFCFFSLVCELVFFFSFRVFSVQFLFFILPVPIDTRVVEIFRISVCQLLNGIYVSSYFFESVVRQLLWSRGGSNDNTTRKSVIRNILKKIVQT